MKDPGLSVLMPAYNHEKYVGEAIRSVPETFQDFELIIIIINGDSTDNAEAEILKFRDERTH